jgi:hypothetical protein
MKILIYSYKQGMPGNKGKITVQQISSIDPILLRRISQENMGTDYISKNKKWSWVADAATGCS